MNIDFEKENKVLDISTYSGIGSLISCVDNDYELSLFLFQKVYRNSLGLITSIEYYNKSNKIYKKIFYEDSENLKIQYFMQGLLQKEEFYKDEKLIYVSKYDLKTGKVLIHTEYKYTRNLVCSILQQKLNHRYEIKYDYDVLDRIVKRTFSVNSDEIYTQEYKYDVLNRVVFYKDYNQTINVNQYNSNNCLQSYNITDNMQHNIIIENEYIGVIYSKTKIDNDGCLSIVEDCSYVDNVMLKKPVPRIEDIDFVISNVLKKCSTKRIGLSKKQNDIFDNLIKTNIQHMVLPISIRKRLLYNQHC